MTTAALILREWLLRDDATLAVNASHTTADFGSLAC